MRIVSHSSNGTNLTCRLVLRVFAVSHLDRLSKRPRRSSIGIGVQADSDTRVRVHRDGSDCEGPDARTPHHSPSRSAAFGTGCRVQTCDWMFSGRSQRVNNRWNQLRVRPVILLFARHPGGRRYAPCHNYGLRADRERSSARDTRSAPRPGGSGAGGGGGGGRQWPHPLLHGPMSSPYRPPPPPSSSSEKKAHRRTPGLSLGRNHPLLCARCPHDVPRFWRLATRVPVIGRRRWIVRPMTR